MSAEKEEQKKYFELFPNQFERADFFDSLTNENISEKVKDFPPVIQSRIKFDYKNKEALALIHEWDSILNLSFDEIGKIPFAEVTEMVGKRILEIPDLIRTKQLEKVKTKRIENFFMTTAEVGNSVFSGRVEVGEGIQGVHTNKRAGKFATIELSFDDFKSDDIQLSSNFVPFEQTVHNAVGSLFKKNDFITAYMVYEVLTASYFGKHDANPSESILSEINNVIHKLTRTFAKIDLTKDLKNKLAEDDSEQYLVEGYLVPANRATKIVNGKKTYGYEKLGDPLLFRYAENIGENGQIATVDLKYLKTSLKTTKEIIVITHYLAYRIELMRNPKNAIKEKKIKYDTIFEQIEFTQKTPRAIANKKSKLKAQYIPRILEDMKNNGFIKSYDLSNKTTILIEPTQKK